MAMLLLAAVSVVALISSSVSATTQLPTPLTCQPPRVQRPIFHIIGNVTQNSSGALTFENINDANGVFRYKGVWHVFHQCCREYPEYTRSILPLHGCLCVSCVCVAAIPIFSHAH